MTQEEVTNEFLSEMWQIVDYWGSLDEKFRNGRGKNWKLEGLLHSFLCLIDGGNAGMPGFLVVPDPHPSYKEQAEEEGNALYWPELPEGWSDKVTTVNGNHSLHEIMHRNR
jgi:hypothetical protein